MSSGARRALAPAAVACACLAWTFVPSAAGADPSLASDTVEDIKLYFTAPARWDEEDWVAFAAAVAAVGVAHQFDARVRSHFATGPNDGLNGGQDKNAVRDALPAVALIGGTFTIAAYLGDSDGYRETWSLLEAGVLSTVTGEVLSYAAGRQRPDGSTSPNRWRAGGDSFPSVHATAAFAIGTVFAESGNDEYRWIRRIIGYGVAGYTAYERVKENVHWTSDTVAGAAIGIATARFVLDRREHPASRTSFDIEPTKNGWQAAYTVQFR
ncbi:MAG TPA: phosphatase PAP2 family protein [Steroidobacteraceae bacterium]|nr:phosphatase PAP2 family protein [Steroidobacteraceae bacterium]